MAIIFVTEPCLQGVILYVGFFGLAAWRWLGHWKTQVKRDYPRLLNYISGLYILVGCLFVLELVLFVLAVVQDFRVANSLDSNTAIISLNMTGVSAMRRFLNHDLSLPDPEPRLSEAHLQRREFEPYADHPDTHFLAAAPEVAGTTNLTLGGHSPVILKSSAAAFADQDLNELVFEHDDILNWPVIWVRTLILASPAVFLVIISLAYCQSQTHLGEIMESQDEATTWEHDRVLNILAVPPVYGVMVFAALVHLYYVTTSELQAAVDRGDRVANSADAHKAVSAFESLIYIADLYEAWALYQFGQLTCDVLERSLAAHDAEDAAASAEAGASHQHPALTAHMAFQAVSKVMWVGAWLFIAVCLAQAGWALVQWFFGDPSAASFEDSLSKFTYAGLVASAAAIYNVHIVESSFGHYIPGYMPFIKFLSVKLLVFFSFWQGYCLRALNFVGILSFSSVEIKLLQAALLMFECLLGSLVHIWAWDYREGWYAADPTLPATEKTPLLKSA
mmetsp:Transcript_32005/g.75018  ORF Transcript_32005/g.75018 Transcript_32005/m.75018 type:complete len:505 (-) Transcript_32005:190-1704(-)